MAAGNYEPIREIVYPLFEHYAKKCRADFHSIEDIENPQCPVLDKFRVCDFLKDYDRLLFLDGDILIRPDCPDLFKMVPSEWFAAYDEGSQLWSLDNLTERLSAIGKLASLWQLEQPIFPSTFQLGSPVSYYNSGVFLMHKCHEYVWRKPEIDPLPLPNVPCAEQVYMNWALAQHKTKVYHLPVCFNQMPHNYWRDYQHSSYMLHYAGNLTIEERIAEMKKGLDVWSEYYGFTGLATTDS